MECTYYIPIGGTGSWDKDDKLDWWEKHSEFSDFLYNQERKICQYRPNYPFIWTTGLEIFNNSEKRHWKAGGRALLYYLRYIPFARRNIIAHSHAWSLVRYAAQYGAKIRNLITIGSPRREDVLKETSRANIQRHLHILDKRWDTTAMIGQILDGQFSFDRTIPDANENLKLENIGHSCLLKDRILFYKWIEHDIIGFLEHGERQTLESSYDDTTRNP